MTKYKKFTFLPKIAFVCALLSLFCGVHTIAVNAETPLTINADGRVYKLYSPELTISGGEYHINRLDDFVQRVYLDTRVNPVDAEVVFKSDGGLFVKEDIDGREIDVNSLKAQIIYALDSGKRKIEIRSHPVTADITAVYLRQETKLRASFSTAYIYSSEERKNNIKLAAESLNGVIIDLYSDFSFNETVGERTAERGYKDAKIIIDGKFVTGTGGGVCQVSTTLYNAAIRAGLIVKEYHRHSLAVSYVPPSFDAMVSGSACDLKLKNRTGRRAYIGATANGSVLTVFIYGAENEYTYEFKSEIDEIIPADIKKVSKDSGETEIAPKNGIKSSAYVSVYKNGLLISSYKLRSDVYSPINGVVFSE